MAINWGTAVANAINTGLNTYSAINNIQRNELETKRLEQALADEAAEKQISANTFGKVGQQTEFGQAIAAEGKVGDQQAKALSDQVRTGDQAFDTAAANSAVGALRENASAQGVPGASGPAAALKPQEYTEDQAYKDYTRQLAGVNPKGARAARLEGLQVKKAVRESNYDDKFDAHQTEYQKTLEKIHATGAADGMKGLAAEAKKNGLSVNFVTGKNGVGAIHVLDDKGKPVQMITNTADAEKALAKAAQERFTNQVVGMFKDPSQVATYLNQRTENSLNERKVAVLEDLAPAQKAYYGSGGRPRGETSKEKIEYYAQINAEADGRTTPNAADRKKAAQDILKTPETKNTGLAENGIMQVEGKYYQQTPQGLVPLQIPGRSAVDERLNNVPGDPFAR